MLSFNMMELTKKQEVTSIPPLSRAERAAIVTVWRLIGDGYSVWLID